MNHNCYHCGEPGHVRRNCPQRAKVPAPAEAAASPVDRGFPPPVPPRLPPEEIGDYPRHAAAIRNENGWSVDSREQRLRERALAQVAECRNRYKPADGGVT